jgi:hypothetical protein
VLRDENGRVLRTLDAQRAATAADRFAGAGFLAEMPLIDIPAGAYVMRLEARAGVDNSTSVNQEIPIRLR